MKNFKNLKEARQAAGFTQKQLADLLFVEHQTISNIERRKNLPSLPLARAICKVLGCTWDIFFDD